MNLERPACAALPHAPRVPAAPDAHYAQALTKLQQQRETWETKAINVMKQLQDLEIKRINHLKNLFREIAQTFNSLLPEIEKVRCVQSGGRRRCAPGPLRDLCRYPRSDDQGVLQPLGRHPGARDHRCHLRKAVCSFLGGANLREGPRNRAFSSQPPAYVPHADRGTGPYVGEKLLYDAYEESGKVSMNTGRRGQRLALHLAEWKKVRQRCGQDMLRLLCGVEQSPMLLYPMFFSHQNLNKAISTREGLLRLWDG